MSVVLLISIVPFSYHGLLELWHGDKRQKTVATKEQPRREDLSIHKMEWQVDTEMFLDEYLHWEVGFASLPDSSDVSPSSPFREKGGRMHGLLRPSTWPPTSGPTGGHLCHPGSGALDQQGRN